MSTRRTCAISYAVNKPHGVATHPHHNPQTRGIHPAAPQPNDRLALTPDQAHHKTHHPQDQGGHHGLDRTNRTTQLARALPARPPSPRRQPQPVRLRLRIHQRESRRRLRQRPRVRPTPRDMVRPRRRQNHGICLGQHVDPNPGRRDPHRGELPRLPTQPHPPPLGPHRAGRHHRPRSHRLAQRPPHPLRRIDRQRHPHRVLHAARRRRRPAPHPGQPCPPTPPSRSPP